MSIYDKPSREMLLEAINIQNGLTANPLTWEQIASGYPEDVLTPGADRNTRVLIYGLNGGGYKGNVAITYDRIEMAILFRNVVPMVVTNPVNQLSELLPFLNKEYGTSFVAEDVEDFSVKEMGESWIADVKIKPSCLAWKGTFQLRYGKFFPNLADVITDVDLSAIIAPIAVGAKPHAEYVTYGYDWTDLRQQFETDWAYNRTITAADVDMLNEVVPLSLTYAAPADAKPGEISLRGARYLGYSNVVAKSTYNLDYRRVATITLAATSNYTGSLYLHYLPV